MEFVGDLVVPRLTTVERNALVGITEGSVINNTTVNKLEYFNGIAWITLHLIDDAGTTTTDLWSADKIQTAIDAAVAGGVNYQGGYNASTNTPDLETPAASAVLKGYMYKVTVAGTFFTEPLNVGDTIIADQDDPSVLAHWTVLQDNLDDASETVKGVTQIATQAEVNTGTDDFKYVTALKLAGWKSNESLVSSFAVDLDGAGEASVVRAFAAGITTFTVTHNLGKPDVQLQTKVIATGAKVLPNDVTVSSNVVDVIFSGNIADDVYRVIING